MFASSRSRSSSAPSSTSPRSPRSSCSCGRVPSRPCSVRPLPRSRSCAAMRSPPGCCRTGSDRSTRSAATGCRSRSATGTRSASSRRWVPCSPWARRRSPRAAPAARSQRRCCRCSSLALYFTFSRGSWLALAVGLAVTVALDPAGCGYSSAGCVMPPSVIAVWLAWRSHALTTLDSAAAAPPRTAIDSRSHSSSSSPPAPQCRSRSPRQKRGSRPDGRRDTRSLGGLAGACLGVVLAVAAAGGPIDGRPQGRALLRVGARQRHATDEPLSSRSRATGASTSGASPGTSSRPIRSSAAAPGATSSTGARTGRASEDVRDAHSLYLETAAELGLVGLGLLGLMLAAPFLAARSRRLPLVPVALGAYAAYLVHAGVDWDWEMPAVTLTALVCGAAALIAARGTRPSPAALAARPLRRCRPRRCRRRVRARGFAGNRAAAASVSAAVAKKWDAAAADARSAQTGLPWSAEPWQLLGDARFGAGDFAEAATAYRRAIATDPRNWQLWFDLGYDERAASRLRPSPVPAPSIRRTRTSPEQEQPTWRADPFSDPKPLTGPSTRTSPTGSVTGPRRRTWRARRSHERSATATASTRARASRSGG